MPRLSLAAAILAVAAPVSARPELVEYGTGIDAREAVELTHASCEQTVELHGAIATGELRLRIANGGTRALAASEDLQLPRGAVVTGFAVGADVGMAVATGFATVAADDVIGADPAVLVAAGDDRYRATLQPIAPGRDAQLIVKWTALAEVREGALRLVLPADPRMPCHTSARASAGPGAAIAKLEPGPRFDVQNADVTLVARLGFGARQQPLVWTQSEDLGDGWTTTIATVLAPPHHADGTGAHRVLFVIDTSRSMDLVGRAKVVKVVDAVAATLPEGSQVEAILFDRKAARVLGEWGTVGAATVGKIDAAIAARPALNGSDIVTALQLAHGAIADGSRVATMVVSITDGVFGDLAETALPQALAGTTSSVDFHAIVIDPGPTRSPGIELLSRPVALYGGSIVEVPVAELDAALGSVESWLRPAWMDVVLAGSPVAIASQLPAGGGASYAFVVEGPAPRLALTSKELHVAQDAAPHTPIAALALASAGSAAFYATTAPSEQARDRADRARAKARRLHPAADDAHAFAVLASTGKVALDRRAMIKGGGPYARIVALADQARPPEPPSAKVAPVASAIARDTLERLFRDQLQPRAYVCYQRALGVSPNLVGTAYFEIRLGRGEISEVQLTGFGDAKLDACLLDAAYSMQPPLPDYDVNADDQTVARYPLTFNLRADKPIIVLGDADSESPLDIDAIPAGVPMKTVRRAPVKVDTSSPLGKMRPPKN